MARPEPRVQALEALYAAEARKTAPDTSDISARAARLVAGVWQHLDTLDVEIDAAAAGWRIERMPSVDRNLLRLALYELRYTDTPAPVVISQAVELAKQYSTERSGTFVNGVLGKLVEEPATPDS